MSPTHISADPARGDACPGALRLHSADDGFLARVRIPGGVLTVAQARALGALAGRLGDGALHLTSRGNVQLRGLRDGCGGELADALSAAGLLPSPAHERVRNVVASPMSGLDGAGHVDVRGWLRGLDAALCASSVTPELSGRFLFALDDGRGDVAGLGADVLVRGLPGGDGLLSVGGAEFSLPYGDAARAAVIAAEVFVEAAREVSGRRVWRVAELGLPAAELTARLSHRLGLRPAGARGTARPATTNAHPATDTGLRPGPRSSNAGGADSAPPGARGTAREAATGDQPTHDEERPAGARGTARPATTGSHPAATGIALPFGTASPDQWAALTARAAELPAQEIRLTPWRRIVIPGATDEEQHPETPWTRVGACIGSPGCAKSHTDVRADATAHLAEAHPTLPTYWSGCDRRCGHPAGTTYIDITARPDGGYDTTTRTTPQPR
ncbi:cobalamin biosynthesis protein CobG [Streptomyces sp. NPDC046716]|uniref:cobalamin biosynthesis protein CobG n=1 Tax=Streptomyces sp. NPDC046716 TaxID=3157093 RepID=UPI0033F36C6C